MKQEKPITICLLLFFLVFCSVLCAQDTTRKSENVPIIGTYEELPEFRGGMKALGELISTCTMYPDSARLNGITGKVFVRFIVTENGDIIDVKVLRGIGYGCDEEAMRVIRLTAGNWIPGRSDGKPVKVMYNLPIYFKMN
jgi:protein TonB